MYCNNLALIQRIGWHEKRIVTTPKDVFRPDYDIKASIKETIEILRHHKIFITFEDIKTVMQITKTCKKKKNSM